MSTPTPQPGDPAATTPPAPTSTPGATPVAAPSQPTSTEPPIAKPDGVSDAEWEALGDPGKAALVRVRAEAAASAAEAARLRKEIEDGKKTAEQKAADALKAAQGLAEQNAAKALRYEIAAEKGLDLKLAPRLTGTTREELEADADVLMGLIPKPETQDPPTPTPGQPVPTIGKTPPAPGNVSLPAQIAAAEAAGDKALVASLKAIQLGQTPTIT